MESSKENPELSSVVDTANLVAIARPPTFEFTDGKAIRCIIWKIYEADKMYKGESQGSCPTFELTMKHHPTEYTIQSKSNSSWTMLDNWDDKKAPCHVLVWKESTGSKDEIMWCYDDASSNREDND